MSLVWRVAIPAAGFRRGLAVVWLTGFAAFRIHAAEVPRIDLIEWYPRYPHEVSIHFATAPNRTHALQFLDHIATNAVLTNTSTWGSWSNLYVVQRVPFPDHHVFVDTTTNSRRRFYRLRVTP